MSPSAQTSVAGVMAVPREVCSGDIHIGEPIACVADGTLPQDGRLIEDRRPLQ